jgi:hypothetical protein
MHTPSLPLPTDRGEAAWRRAALCARQHGKKYNPSGLTDAIPLGHAPEFSQVHSGTLSCETCKDTVCANYRAMGGDTTRSGNGIGRQAEFVHAQARGARGWLAWRLGVVGTHMYVHVHVCGARTHNTHMCACKMPLTLAFVAAVKVVLRRQKAANPRWWRSRTSMCKLPFNPRGKQNQAGGSWDGPIPGCSILMRAPNMHGQSGANGVCACVRWKDPVFWVSAKRAGNKCCVARNSVLCWQGRMRVHTRTGCRAPRGPSHSPVLWMNVWGGRG